MGTWNHFPTFGTALLMSVMIVAGYTFAVSLVAGATGRVRTLQAARFGAYGTVTLVFTAVLALAYAFVSHDFRIRYVAHYSDRSMPIHYLLTALWGGQDGSLLWWLFLMSIYIGVCTFAMGKKWLQLQPYVIATQMGIVIFFCILMTFAANPFGTSVSGGIADGTGLNPLLQNFYMIIHPPSLYVGFVGCSIPFSFAVAALVTGRLDTEWMTACRKFTLFSWMFLAIGNTLGMLWAYEELGWGGYWAWDPVENAAFMPLLSASAFLHSTMIQERRGMFKVWNVVLVSLTFFMTIFGTFLTRSGAIASVHSFAQSSIGTYFVYFLVLVAAFSFTLILYRWPELRDIPPTRQLRRAAIATGWSVVIMLVLSYVVSAKIGGSAALDEAARRALGVEAASQFQQKQTLIKVAVFSLLAGASAFAAIELVFRRMTGGKRYPTARPEIESFASREFTFLLNNWGLLSFMFGVCIATTFPMISEAFWNEKVSVGPPVYNAWVQPLGLTIFFLMGVGTLFGWKKTSEGSLRRNFIVAFGVMAGTIVLHFIVGERLGYPAMVWTPPIYPGPLGAALRAFNAFTPVLGISLVTFNATVIIREFAMLFRARAKTGAGSNTKFLWYAGILPGFLYTMFTLPAVSRRRYGGYIVHLGITFMVLGFTGHSWDLNKETTLAVGQTYQIERLTLEFVGPREEIDNEKRMDFADVRVTENGKVKDQLTPAKFFYKKMPQQPTTEVSMMHTLRDDLYIVVGSIDKKAQVATFQIHLNRLVSFIWFGCLVLIFGSTICMFPELVPGESRAWRVARGAAGITASIFMGVVIALAPTQAFAQGQGASSLHAGTVHIEDDNEKSVFSALRCMCGGCARDLLSTCACADADRSREGLRAKIRAGETRDQILAEYAAVYGSEALAIPPNTGVLRALYLIPVVGTVGSAIGVAMLARRWRSKDKKSEGSGESEDPRDVYDERLDDELRNLDG